MRLRLFALFLAWIVPLAAAAPAHAQGGYAKQRYPQHGLKFELARNYEWLAIQPNEEWVVLQWIYQERSSGVSKEKPRSPRAAPRMQVVRIDYRGDPGPATPGGLGPSTPKEPAEDEGEESSEKKKPEPPVLPINSWERYLDQKLGRWQATEIGTGRERDGYESSEYKLQVKKGRSSTKGWAYVWNKSRTRTFIVLGWSIDKDWKDQGKIWRRTAEKMRFAEPQPDPEVEKLERYYKRKPKFKAPAYRIRVRGSLDGDWEAEDTENYIIIHNTPDQPLVRRIVRDMESIRKEYVKLFPAASEIEAVSTVRICADRDEYMQYGGPSGSAGYWNWVTEELVLYDGTKREKGKKTDKLDTFIVLYHEAFHQYIHYSAGKLSPHTWFNEGYGDYFSGALIKGGKVKRILPNRWRLKTIQNAIRRNRHTRWGEIIEYEKPQYYNRAKVGQNYAQGWSMVYFLNKSKMVINHPKWSLILPTYFDVLKASWITELAKLVADGMQDDREERAKGQLAARQSAHAAAFEGVDLAELEAVWAKFVCEIKL
jgi:hypothetical protein